MNCNTFEELIALYAEGDLDASLANNVESHLKSCASCQRFLGALEASQEMVKELAAEPLDPASFSVVRQRVMQEVNRRQAQRPLWWRLFSPALAHWRPVWAAALVVLVALGLLWQWQLWRRPGGARPDIPTVASAPTVQEQLPGTAAPEAPESMTFRTKQSFEPEPKQFATRHKAPVAQELALPAGAEPIAATEEPEAPVEQGSNLEPEVPQPADITPEPPPPLVIKLITDDPNIVIVWLVDQDVHHN